MTFPRTLLPFLMVTLLAVLLAACGSDSSDSSSSSDSRDAGKDAQAEEPEPGTPEGTEAKTGVASIAITPELTACMRQAGFTQDTTPAPGSIASWTHEGGTRVAVAPSSEVALTLAGELGTAESPASVDGARVSTGDSARINAAGECLDRVAG